MKVLLTLRGVQTYIGQEPDTIELVTEGTLIREEDGWKIDYDESQLTGLEGVHTCFLVQNDMLTLTRTGNLRSQMIFQRGQPHTSLYQMQFGAMMITVCATAISCRLSEKGGTVDLKYTVEIENSAAGTVDYHLKIRAL